jgi:hypothetical protein
MSVAAAWHMGSTCWASVVAGAINGTITGAAMGFASGYAGGKGTLDEILVNMGEGAGIGHVAGAVLGGLSSVLKPPSGGVVGAAEGALNEQHWGAGQMPGGEPSAAAPPTTPGTPMSNNPVEASLFVGQGVGGKVLGAVLSYTFKFVMSSATLAPIGSEVLVDTAAGAWDLYGMKALYALPVLPLPPKPDWLDA